MAGGGGVEHSDLVCFVGVQLWWGLSIEKGDEGKIWKCLPWFEHSTPPPLSFTAKRFKIFYQGIINNNNKYVSLFEIVV